MKCGLPRSQPRAPVPFAGWGDNTLGSQDRMHAEPQGFCGFPSRAGKGTTRRSSCEVAPGCIRWNST